MFNHTYTERFKQMLMRIGNIEVALDIELDLDYLNAGGVSYIFSIGQNRFECWKMQSLQTFIAHDL